MTKQPLTPRNPAMVAVAPNAELLSHALLQYGIPTDPGNVEPAVAVTRISSREELTAFLATAPSPLLPWCVVAQGWTSLTDVHALQYLTDNMSVYFGRAQSMASCLDMLNNEYAVNPKNLRG